MHLPAGAFRPCPTPAVARVTIVPPEVEDLASVTAVAAVGFSAPGTERGTLGHDAVVDAAARLDERLLGFTRERMSRGLTVTAVARVDRAPVAVGSHNPVGDATEIVGVATLPAFRRKGLGSAVTSALVEHALAHSIDLVLLSAGDEATARAYARLGFRAIGTVGAAGPPEAAA